MPTMTGDRVVQLDPGFTQNPSDKNEITMEGQVIKEWSFQKPPPVHLFYQINGQEASMQFTIIQCTLVQNRTYYQFPHFRIFWRVANSLLAVSNRIFSEMRPLSRYLNSRTHLKTGQRIRITARSNGSPLNKDANLDYLALAT